MVAKGRQATGDRMGHVTHPESIVRGERVNTAKLTSRDVQKILHLVLAEYRTQRSVAEMFGVSQVLVGKIVRGKVWRHVQSSERVGLPALAHR
jgi:predicted XRE-type DNA-binding protein